MDRLTRMKELISLLNQYTIAYDLGKPLISDHEWDSLYFELSELEKSTGVAFGNSPTQSISYNAINELAKVEHSHKMLSLAKTKDVAEVEAFINGHSYVAMCKMDGLTCSLTYEDGFLIAAETRGNGFIGEDILHNAKVISSIPTYIPEKGRVVVDGEIICTFFDFEIFANEYKNPRNFAAGSIRLLDPRECAKRKLTFVAWDVIEGLGNDNSLIQKFMNLTSNGFTVVPHIAIYAPTSVNQYTIDLLKRDAEILGYPIDGIVFKFEDIAYGRSLGETSHHFKNAIAYKFYDETYPSKLLNIEWTMGRTGILTPVAVFSPVDIDGSVVERANLHNLSILKETLHGRGWRGQNIEVYKANMIIPQIASAEEDDERTKYYFMPPTLCPICKSPTGVKKENDSEFLICENPNCEGKLINRLDHFCGKKGLDIKGLSKATLQKLIDWGWVSNKARIFCLDSYRDEWVQKPGFGAKSVDKILNAIKEASCCEFCQYLSALGIPLIGTSASKQLAKVFKNYTDMRIAMANGFKFYELPNFGIEMHQSLYNFNFTEADMMIGDALVTFKEVEKTEIVSSASLDGLTFVITGKLSHFKNRDEIKSRIESLGGKVTGSVSKNTSYLINNDKNSTSTKNKSAQTLGIPILTEEEFIETFGIQ